MGSPRSAIGSTYTRKCISRQEGILLNMTSPSQGRRSRRLDRTVKFPAMTIDKSKLIWAQSSSQTWKGRQITVSEDHPKDSDGKFREGGPFFTTRVSPNINWRDIVLKGNVAWGPATYQGPAMVPLMPSYNVSDSGMPKEDSSYLDPIGAEAISIVDPMNPNAQTGVALGEILKDRKLPIPGIPTWRDRTKVVRAAGSEYLNAVFGWLPLVKDIKDTSQSILDGNEILKNYRAASGTLVHREFEFPHIESESESIRGSNCAFIGWSPNELSPGSVPITRHEKVITRRWFSGSFTYHAGGGNSLSRMLGIGSEAEKLFGITLTPDLLWELTPWSWAADWFSNAGNVISNINSFKLAGLVMQYGYIMEESTIRITYSMPSAALYGVTGTVPPIGYVITTKRRREANPFGFGLSWDGLSPTQLAITAALGITRLR